MARRINYEELSRDEILDEIMKKKEFSELPRTDVGLVYALFEKRDGSIEEKIKETRDLLRKMYTAFVSDKLLSVKDKEADWFLRKHISTAERMGNYSEIYSRALRGIVESSVVSCQSSAIQVFDFGCGINGFSYEEFLKAGFEVGYIGTEPVGQLCKLQNVWFEKRKMKARVEHISLFDLEENKELVSKASAVSRQSSAVNGQRSTAKVAFFFKVLDSLEMMKKDYSKEVLNAIVPMVDRAVVCWATKSLVSKKRFKADRTWLRDFLINNFEVIDEFETEFEKYIVFSKKKQ
ncbi:MAG: hypothetical protein PF542_02100 [Nanoarchaeota archaeon]|jgi:hypothetical protein|nr:hypothetical protein [Nanoarchaeota archaeon]